MRKFTGTIIALLVFVGLLIWVITQERGRVPEEGEVLAKQIHKGGEIVGIESIKYDLATVLEQREKDEAEADATAEEGAESDATEDAASDERPDDEGKDGKKEPVDPKKRIEDRRFAMELRDDEWWFTKPFKGLVDPDTADKLVKAIERLKPDVREDEDPKQEQFGIDNPSLKVIVRLKKGREFTITLGDNTPVGAQIYGAIDGLEGLYLIPSMFKTDMEQEPEKARDKKLARFEKEDVERTTLTNAAGTIVAEKTEKGEKVQWNITSPEKYRADEWQVSSTFGKVVEVEAKEFAADPSDLKSYGLDKPRARCKVELKDGKTVEVIVGKQITKKVKEFDYSENEVEKDMVYAMRVGRPEVLLVETTLFDDLNKDLMALRDKRILDFDRERVASVQVTRKDGFGFAVNRAGDEWVIQKPETGPASKTKVDDILWDLNDLEAEEYLGTNVDLKAKGLAVPQVTITLKLTGKETLKIKIGDKVEDKGAASYYCQVEGDKQVYRVREMVMLDLPEKIEDLKPSATGTDPSADDPLSGIDLNGPADTESEEDSP